MRIRVARRILLLGIVLALLFALPAVVPSFVDAKPYNWDRDSDDPNNPGPTKGDGDGTIVKARSIDSPTTTYESSSTTTVQTQERTWSAWRTYLSLVRWGLGLRWGAF